MRSVVSRLAGLERLNRLSTAPPRLRIQYGYLEPGEDWYKWEERPGPETVSMASGPSDEILVQVRYVEAKPKA